MAITLVNAAGYRHGIASAESGVNAETITVSTEPQIRAELPDINGEATGFAVSAPRSTITISGEVSNVATYTGLVAATFATAATVANFDDLGGQTTGGVYATSLEVTQNRNGWTSFTFNGMRVPGIA